MAAIEGQHVWVFNGRGRFPGGVFTTVERAEAWIRQHRLTGVLTAYPLDEGSFDWARRCAVTGLKADKLTARQDDPEFIASFSTASQPHFHYENGERPR